MARILALATTVLCFHYRRYRGHLGGRLHGDARYYCTIALAIVDMSCAPEGGRRSPLLYCCFHHRYGVYLGGRLHGGACYHCTLAVAIAGTACIPVGARHYCAAAFTITGIAGTSMAARLTSLASTALLLSLSQVLCALVLCAPVYLSPHIRILQALSCLCLGYRAPAWPRPSFLRRPRGPLPSAEGPR